MNYYYLHGEGGGNKLVIGENVSTMNAVFNINSGSITIEENTIFGHNVSLITGTHRFYNGKLAKLATSQDICKEVPDQGFDIRIGAGCFLATNVVVVGGVEIGRDSIICAGAVVTKNIPNGSVAAGVPAKIIGLTAERS